MRRSAGLNLTSAQEENTMSYIRVIVDYTKKVGCPDCGTYRATMYKDPNHKHWQTCKEHKRCVEIQHIAHQPETEEARLDGSYEEHVQRLADIEMQDGSIERELNTMAENKYEIKEQAIDPEYYPEPAPKPIKDKIHSSSEQEQLIHSLLHVSERALRSASWWV